MLITLALAWVVVVGSEAWAVDAPEWMHALVKVPLPAYDEKTDAVLLYSEINITVVSTEKIKTQVRMVYKIMRPSGRERGTVLVPFHIPLERVTTLHGWCIPAEGKDYEVKDKDAVEVSEPMVQGSELIDDLKVKMLRIPASDVGNIIGYEYEIEKRPLVLQSEWRFQGPDPVRETRYSLQMPPGWEYKQSWLNYPQLNPVVSGNRQQWTVTDVKAIRPEPEMPPLEGVAGQMIVSFFPSGGPSIANGFSDWRQMGSWYKNLEQGRAEASPQIQQQVAVLTTGRGTPLEKMQAIAEFVQHDIRYVGIELGIGGWQPHPAADIFSHRYGDCKDKATLMRSMLHEIGVDSYSVLINTERGSITPETPAHPGGFDHAIVAIKLPQGLSDASLSATLQHPKLGTILFFDPTDETTPFGRIRGNLQANYALVVTPGGGELLELPQQEPAMNGVERTAKFTLDPTGTLKGEVKEMRHGDRARAERLRLRAMTKDLDRIKPIETLLAASVSNFRINRAALINPDRLFQPFGFEYSFESDYYAKNAGGFLLVRPRVLGVKAQGLLETKEPRTFPIELEEPTRDTDDFEITIPPGYVVDELPPPVDSDYSFASYHSKTELKGSVIRYTRTFEVKQLSVPVSQAPDLKNFYRIIASDERNTILLRAK